MNSTSGAAYEISWQIVASAIKRRKYIGKKAFEEMNKEDFEQLKSEIHCVMEHHLDDLLEMSFEAYEIVHNL